VTTDEEKKTSILTIHAQDIKQKLMKAHIWKQN